MGTIPFGMYQPAVSSRRLLLINIAKVNKILFLVLNSQKGLDVRGKCFLQNYSAVVAYGLDNVVPKHDQNLFFEAEFFFASL